MKDLAYYNKSLPFSERARDLVSRMNLAKKLARWEAAVLEYRGLGFPNTNSVQRHYMEFLTLVSMSNLKAS